MQNDMFEWDDDKAAINFKRHKVSFEAAGRAFQDAFGIAREDSRENYREARFNLLGMVDSRLLHVTYTMRGDRIRIISARMAEPREKRRYHEENN